MLACEMFSPSLQPRESLPGPRPFGADAKMSTRGGGRVINLVEISIESFEWHTFSAWEGILGEAAVNPERLERWPIELAG